MTGSAGGFWKHAIAVATATLLIATLARSQEPLLAARAATAATQTGTTQHIDALLQEVRLLLRFDIAAANRTAEEAFAQASALDDNERCGVAHALRARCATNTTGTATAHKLISQAQMVMPDDSAPELHAEVHYAAAIVQAALNKSAQALDELRQTVEHAENAGAHHILFRSNLVAWSLLGWPEDRQSASEKMTSLAQLSGDPGLQLEAQVLAMLADGPSLTLTEQIDAHMALLPEAQRLGDRVMEGYLLRSLASTVASTSIPDAADYAAQSLAVKELLGDRQAIAKAHEYIARVHVASERYEEAYRESTLAVRLLEDFGTNNGLIESVRVAARAATLANHPREAREYTELLGELEHEFAMNSDRGQSVELWQLSERLRQELRDMQTRYEAQIDDMDDQMTRIWFASVIILLLIVSTAAAMLFRAKRRADATNVQLQKEAAANTTAQAERKAIEENLQQLERLDSIGMLAGGFAHDFNNILVAIRGNAQLALDSTESDSEQHELIEQVVDSSDRAANLCRDILTHAHSGSTPRQLVDLRELIADMLPMARAGLSAFVELELDPGNEPCIANIDRAQIEQVILNILINANEAIDQRGNIRVRLSHRTLSADPPTGNWFGEFTGDERKCIAIQIRDSGQGMTNETIRRIFDPFYSTRFPGRGLGLAATYGIIRRHDGVIHVDSEPGVGSQFTLFLPRSTDTATPTTEQPTVLTPHQAPPAEPETANDCALVLVVDDELHVARITERALHVAGFDVVTAANDEQALEVVERYGDAIRVAVLDFTMPDMDGATLAQQLHDRLPGLRTMLMSGQDEQTVRSAAPNCTLLQKPFDIKTLTNAVQQLHAQV